MTRFKKVLSLVLLMICSMSLLNVSALALPPDNPHIASGSADDGGNFFEYKGSNGWYELKTPPHWVVETGEVAYCLDHKADNPYNDLYGEFDPTSVYSNRTYIGLLAIMEHSYPYRTAGLTSQQIRYSTANAIRSWLKESAGIGYDFMLPSNNAVRPKNAACQSTYNFYMQLLDKARNGYVVGQSLKVSPDVIELELVGDMLQGKATVTYGALNGKYTINESKLSPGMSVSGYTGNSGDELTFNIPVGIIGRKFELHDILIGYDNRCASNIYWLDDSGSKQAVAVPVVDRMCEVAKASVVLNSDPVKLIISKTDADSGEKLQGAKFGVYTANDMLIHELTTDKDGTIESGNIVLGDYYFKELVAPEGYMLSDEVYSFSVTNVGQIITFDLSNVAIKGRVSIAKTDDVGNSLSGAVYGIYDSEDNPIQELVSDENGYAESEYLSYGSYYVREISAPEGYILADDIHVFDISGNDEMMELEITNCPITGSVEVMKSEPIEGNPLDGVVFAIYDTEDTLIEEIQTDSEGRAVSSRLRYGDYYLKELSLLDHYIPNDEVYEFSISENDEMLSFDIVNIPKLGSVNVKYLDIDNGIELSDPYVFSDWVGLSYEDYITSCSFDKLDIEGYELIKVDYPECKVLSSELGTIVCWYRDSEVIELRENTWSGVYIPKTGQVYPKLSYFMGILCFIVAVFIMGVAHNSKGGKSE